MAVQEDNAAHLSPSTAITQTELLLLLQERQKTATATEGGRLYFFIIYFYFYFILFLFLFKLHYLQIPQGNVCDFLDIAKLLHDFFWHG